MADSDSQIPIKEPSFEQALQSLESIVRQLEEGQLGLAEALARYEQGVKLLKQCYQLLEHAERRIAVLTRVTPEGEAISEKFDDRAATLEEKAATRGRRRSRPAEADEPPCDPPQKRRDVDPPGGLF